MSKIVNLTNQLEDDVEKANIFVHGDENATYPAKDGAKVRSIRNLQKEAQINIDSAGDFAKRAEESAKKSEAASTAAQTNAQLYSSIETALALTENGDFFNVVSSEDDSFVILYKNNDGVAEKLKIYPSSVAITDVEAVVSRKITGSGEMVCFAPAASFNDMGFTHTDAAGHILNDPNIWGALSKQSIDLFISPYSSFDDCEQYSFVDASGAPLFFSDDKSEDFEWLDEIYVRFDYERKELEVSWQHSDSLMLKSVWGPNGHNEVFNFKEIYKSEIGNPKTVEWALVQRVRTDYIPPIWVYSDNEPNSPSGTALVGGNHGTSNGTGDRTAYMRYCDFFINGNKLTSNFEGFAKDITVSWLNDLYAGNTVNEKRFCVEQLLSAIFSKRCVFVMCETHFLEPVRVYSDGGTQMVGAGWNEGAQFYKGQNRAMEAVASSDDFNSGNKSEYPEVWATVLKSDDLGFAASWIDRSYGVKNNFVADDEQLSFKGKNLYKFYNFAIRSPGSPFRFKKGESYSWKGGYSYFPEDLIGNIESAFSFKNNNKKCVAFASKEFEPGALYLPPEFLGREFENINTLANRVVTDGSKYIADFFKEK